MRAAAFILTVLTLSGCTVTTAPEDDLEVSPGDVGDEGKADGSSGPTVELKVTVASARTASALSRLRLRRDRAERRWVHFYDTPDLQLFEQGVILRARKVADDDDDSSVKVRPLDADEAPAEFVDLEDFECETDMLLDRSVPSCKLSAEQDTGEIDDVADGERDISQLFSSEQEDFYAWAAPGGPELDELTDLGPVDAWVWKLSTRSLPAPMTAELWILPDGTQILELSMRVAEDDAEDGLDDLLDYLEGRGIVIGETQETKTRLTLEYFSEALGTAARGI